MSLRRPTSEELKYINANIAKKECKEEGCYIFDPAVMANDFMKTCYNYYLSTRSLTNFVEDLSNRIVPLQINHGGLWDSRRIMPLGRLFNGSLVTVTDLPPDAKQGKSCAASGIIYMPVGLEFDGYNTDQLAKGYEAGTVTDLSVGQDWSEAEFICDVCGKSLWDEDCPHTPGRMYDGVLATFTVDNAHLKEVSLAWKGGLPGASLADGTERAKTTLNKLDWENIKTEARRGQLPKDLMQLSELTIPIDFESDIQGGTDTMTFQQMKEKFSKELAEEYVSKADHDTLSAKLTTTEEALTSKAKEVSDTAARFGNINAELEAKKGLIAIGQKHLEWLTTEFNRLGIALTGDAWNEETEADLVKGIGTEEKQAEYLAQKIEQMTTDLKGKTEKKSLANNETEKPVLIMHKDNPALYQVG